MDWAATDRYPRRRVPAGTVLLREGDFGEVMYFVVKGRLEVTKRVIEGADKVLSTLEAGHYVGEMSLLTGARRSATVKAVEDAEVIEIDQAAFVQLLHDSPQVGLELMRQMAQRLAEANEQLILLALEAALAQRRPVPVQPESRQMRFVAIGSFTGEKMLEVLRVAAQQGELLKNQGLVASLVRPGRLDDALIYIVETENPQALMALIGPFAGLVAWDISPAIGVEEALAATEKTGMRTE